MVVRLSVGIIRSVVEVKCDIEEVDDLEVSLDCDVQSVGFEMSRDVLSYSFCLWTRGVFEYCQFVVSVKTDVFFSVSATGQRYRHYHAFKKIATLQQWQCVD